VTPTEQHQHPGSTAIGSYAFPAGDTQSCVEVRLPARSDMWGLVRMAVSTVASVMNASIDRIEDLRIAVAELCTLCAAGASDQTTLSFLVRFDSEMIGVSCTAVALSGSDDNHAPEFPDGFTPGEISRKILEALVDDFAVSETEQGSREGWFVARADS
jgi:hypothetical protein